MAVVHPAGGLPDGQRVLMPSMPVEGGFTGYPEERVAEVANLQTA